MAAHLSTVAALKKALEVAGVEFIDENGGGPGVQLRKRQQKKGKGCKPPSKSCREVIVFAFDSETSAP
jgi:hypothetical protein